MPKPIGMYLGSPRYPQRPWTGSPKPCPDVKSMIPEMSECWEQGGIEPRVTAGGPARLLAACTMWSVTLGATLECGLMPVATVLPTMGQYPNSICSGPSLLLPILILEAQRLRFPDLLSSPRLKPAEASPSTWISVEECPVPTTKMTNQIKSVPAKRTVLSDSAARINRKRSVKTPISPAEVPSEWERDAEEAQTDTQAKSTKKKTSPTPAKGAPNSNPIVKTTTTGTRQNAINSINSIKIPLRSKSQAQPSILSGSDLANAARALPDLSKIQIPLKPKSQAQPSILPGNGLAKEARALSDLNKIKIKVVEQPANPPSAYSKKTINKPVASSSRNKIDSYFVPQGRTTVIALSDSSIISKDSDQEFTSEPYDPTSESELEIITEATGRLSTKQRTLPELPEADTLKSYPRALRPLLETVSINLKYWKELIEQNNKPLQILALKTAADVQETLLNKLSLDEFKAIFDQWDPILEMKMTTRKGLTLMEKRRQISSQEMLQLQDGVYLSRPEVVNHPNNLEPMGPESNEEEMETFTSLPTSDSSTSSNQSIKTSQSAPAGIPSEPKKHEAKKSEEQPSTSTLSASLPTDRQDESKAQLSSLNPPGDHPLGTNPSRDLPGVGSNAVPKPRRRDSSPTPRGKRISSKLTRDELVTLLQELFTSIEKIVNTNASDLSKQINF
ncbi:hypothetical protein PSTG_12570 [Puccinia striiformis f. sp. tritici PST-78]|uniref:Uncharacterized protein n=1 Tax=Puccinia striiformis f. sp. tritici PST-78 TaxID=1165861 RepID=A0A0L0V509_9BASI|nr:hypothetical protein PSTG_12570 [Puccinia striiformis f. sp. tritici PST-78]